MLKTLTAAGLGLALIAGPTAAQNPTGAAIVAAETRAGTYTVEVSMADCTGQCHWGVGVFR